MITCPSCQTENPVNAKFCNQCGSPLHGAKPAQASVQTRDGAVVQGNYNTTVSAGGVFVDGDVGGSVIVIKEGGQVVTGEQPVAMSAEKRDTALGRYLEHVIARNRYLQLQGIGSGGKIVNIELEHIYITLKASRTRSLQAEEAWLAEERRLAPGEAHKLDRALGDELVAINVQEALAEHHRLVVLGDPGSGKTTLLRYLALTFARDRAEGGSLVRERLCLDESGCLPVLLPLRNLGAFLKSRYPQDEGVEGHGRLLEFLRACLKGERLNVPEDFFDADLADGKAVILLDGMDEVGDADLRRRVARLIEAFAVAYPACRLVVTSRIVGYTGAARLGEEFTTATVRDFSLADVELFLTNWHRLAAAGLMGPSESAEAYAAEQTGLLMAAIRDNPRVRELAINPLMLTVIALVHRERVKLPDRRAELYAEAVNVLLGKWDEARGVAETRILEERSFDVGDRRLLLQSLALWMHARQQREIAAEDLRRLLAEAFASLLTEKGDMRKAVERFLTVVQERTGLLVEAGPGAYRFSHLTFQEYLAAVEVAERDDYVEYTLQHIADPGWREAILLVAGYLSTKQSAKVTRLIRAIAEWPDEPELFHNLVLAAECIRDVGPNRVESSLADGLRQKLRAELERPLPDQLKKGVAGVVGRLTGLSERRKGIIFRRLAAANALGRIESGSFGAGGQYWSLPHGEPRWISIPAGEFWMGSEKGADGEKPLHRLHLPEYQIAVTPVTNFQYALFLNAEQRRPLPDWNGDLPPKGKESHPVVNVTWFDALAYCEWLSQATGKTISLPSEAEWEKAARGPFTQGASAREYPWGDAFDPARGNTAESGIKDTTPVGLYRAGASPYGVLDLSGNVWEWTRSRTANYPYDARDGREALPEDRNGIRVLRGGSFYSSSLGARCAFRFWLNPGYGPRGIGFRVVVSPCR